jgi:hypothetical protein
LIHDAKEAVSLEFHFLDEAFQGTELKVWVFGTRYGTSDRQKRSHEHSTDALRRGNPLPCTAANLGGMGFLKTQASVKAGITFSQFDLKIYRSAPYTGNPANRHLP